MKKNTGRRSFLKKISITDISAGVVPATLLEQGQANANTPGKTAGKNLFAPRPPKISQT